MCKTRIKVWMSEMMMKTKHQKDGVQNMPDMESTFAIKQKCKVFWDQKILWLVFIALTMLFHFAPYLIEVFFWWFSSCSSFWPHAFTSTIRKTFLYHHSIKASLFCLMDIKKFSSFALTMRIVNNSRIIPCLVILIP